MLPTGEDRFRVLFERSPVGMSLAALDGTIIAVNAATCRLCGRSEQELVGSQATLMVHPDDRVESAGHLRAVLAGAIDEVRRELRILRPDGTVVWADALTHGVRGPDGVLQHLQSVFVDITERRQVGEANSWLAAIVESSQDAIVGVNLDGVIMNWNAGAERIFGYTAAEVIGRSVAVLRPPGIESEVAQITARYLRGESFEQRLVRRRKDGTPVTLLTVSTPILDASGALVGTAYVGRDLARKERTEAMFRSLLEAAPDAVACVDEHGDIALVNAQAVALFGYAHDEMIGSPIELLLPNGAGAVQDVRRQRTSAGPPSRAPEDDQQLMARRQDGSEFPAEISLSAIPTGNGTLVSLAIRDGTQRRQAAIVASSSDAIIGRRLDGIITSWNAGAERMYGYAAADTIGRDLAALIPAELGDEISRLAERVRRGELIEHHETQRRRKDGTLIDVSVSMSPILDAEGSVIGMSAVAHDITESKRALDALRAAEARKSAMLESALDCVITMDHHGLVVEFNPAAERVFGYRRDQAVGQPLAELIIPPSLRDAHRAGLARYLATGEGRVLGQRLELQAVRADGTEFPVELAITRVELPGPAIFTAYVRDISDRVRAEAERRALEVRVRQSERLESLGQLAGGVAHDFNNLLGVILNYAAFLAARTADDAAVRDDVEQIRAAAAHGARLTRQLLIVGRREAIRPEILEFNTIISDIRDLLSRSIGEHVELSVRLAEALPAVRGDRGQIEQVLLNLAVNARDAMPDGGTLTIATRETHVDDDYIRIHPDAKPGRHLELSVSDTGHGMSAAVANRIFEPFFTTKPRGEGTGLGLATVYGIVTEAAGSIGVYSEVGIGTTFRVLLPAADEVPVRAAAPPAAHIAGYGQTVVVVDDEPAMRKVTARILREDGYIVLEAPTGSEALALIGAGDVRLLLTDSVMPQMSGRELAERARQLRPELPVLFMSGYDDGAVGAHGVVPEGVTLIQKPFSAETLLERVGALVSSKLG